MLPDYEFPHLNRFLSYRVGLLRSLRRWLLWRCVGYVTWDSPQDFWRVASRHTPCFLSSLTVEVVDGVLHDWHESQELRATIEPGDRILPVAINVDSLSMRLGYVVLRAGEPVGGVIKVSS